MRAVDSSFDCAGAMIRSLRGIPPRPGQERTGAPRNDNYQCGGYYGCREMRYGRDCFSGAGMENFNGSSPKRANNQLAS